MSWGNVQLANLSEILANLYPTEMDAKLIVAKANLPAARIDFDGSSLNRWFSILSFANLQKRVDAVVAAALNDYPEDEALKRAQGGAPPPAVKGPEASDWQGPSGAGDLERIMGQRSTLVSIAYLEVGLICSRSVVRVKREDGSTGTGFICDGHLLVTNNHVLPDAEVAESSVAQFNYQQTARGLNAPVEEARLLPETFFRTSIADDWTAVKIEGDAPAKWGMLPLTRTAVKVNDHVNIIQHPGGGPKQISMSANIVAFVGAGRVQYLTDTLPGSSGSPVFDSQWNVIALHHSGGWLKEPNAKSKSTFYRNEGIAIERIIDGLANMR